MYKPPEQCKPSSLNKQVLERQEAIRKAFELVRRKRLLNNFDEVPCIIVKCTDQCTKRVTAFSFITPSPPSGCSFKLSSHWRGPYRINKCLNDVNYEIEKIGNGKQLVVHNDRLKRYQSVLAPKSLIPERNPISKIFPTSKQSRRFDHSHCECMTFPTTSFLPLLSVFIVHSPWPRPYPLPLSAPCRRSSYQHLQPLFPLNILSTHPLYKPVPRSLVVKHRSLELLQGRAPLRHLAVEAYDLARYCRQHLLVRPETKHLNSTPLPLLPQTPP